MADIEACKESVGMKGLSVHLGERWKGNYGVRASGCAHIGGVFHTATMLVERATTTSVQQVVTEAVGHFALIAIGEQHAVAAVDVIRSIPLFYAVQNGMAYVSDDASWIHRQIGAPPFDETASAEYLAIGYVTGSDTLVSEIKQLLAGEMAVFRGSEGGISVERIRYYQFIHGGYLEESSDALMARWKGVLYGAFERMLASLQGRPVALPLSGGLDSRLLAMLFKEFGYSNLTCYSYGVEGNYESAISKRVADHLGLPWVFVPYNHDLWYRVVRSREYQNYADYGGNLSSLAHIQDWPAVWELHRSGAVPSDAVFVPGHTGDFIGGGHIPSSFGETRVVGLKKLMHAIQHHHYSLWPPDGLPASYRGAVPGSDVWDAVHQRLLAQLESIACTTPEDAANAIELWDWQERQAKFIVNSVRAYEFWGYDWRLPLWDQAVVDFWSHIPLEQRLGKPLFDAFVSILQSEVGLELPPHRTRRRIKALLRRVGLEGTAYALMRTVKAINYRREYESHPMAWYGVVPLFQFRSLWAGAGGINSILVLERMKLLRFE